MAENLYRTRVNKVAGGVAAGLAEYFKIDLMLIRIFFIILTFFNGVGILIYIILWIILPEKPYDDYIYNMGMQKEKEQAGDQVPQSASNNSRIYFGGFLILLGVLFLIEKVIPEFGFFDILPVFIILAGAYLIFNSVREKKNEKLN